MIDFDMISLALSLLGISLGMALVASQRINVKCKNI
jgi:hypothetical protein